MKKLVLATILTAAVFSSCGDRDRIYKDEPSKGDITIIGGLAGQSCVCTNNNCQCQPNVGSCQTQGQCQGQNQGQLQGQNQNQSGQPISITVNANSNATNKIDISNCQRSYLFNQDNTFTRTVQCPNNVSCKGKGRWYPQQPVPVPPIQQQQQQQSPWTLEYDENYCGDCQSEVVRI